MVKNLRYVLMSMLVMFGMSAYAEDIIWQEDWSGVTNFDMNPNNFKSNYTFTGFVLNDDQATVKSGTKFYDANLAGGTAPELLIAKNGGTFTASINLNGKSGKMTLTYKCNKSITVEEITQKDQMVSEATHVGNDYEREVNVPAGTTEIQLVFTNSSSSNARLDNIKLYQGTAKKAAGLSWGKASTTLTIGEEITLTLSNANNLPVTYSSSKDSVATISQEGVITLKAEGKTVFTASFAGNDEYEAQSVSIEVTVKAAEGGEGGEGGEGQGGEGVQTTGNGTLESPYTVADALIVAGALEKGAKTSNDVFVKGIICSVKYTFSAQYGTATFNISDDGQTGQDVFQCYGIYYLENQAWVEGNTQIKVGDEVIIYGKLMNYNGTLETSNKEAYIYSLNGVTKNGGTPQPESEKITVAQALDIIAALDSSAVTTTVYEIEGFVVSLDEAFNPSFGNYTANIGDTKDATATLKVFRAKNAANQKFPEDVLTVGDKVLVKGKLQKYVDKSKNVIPETKDALIMEINGESTNSIAVVKADSRLQSAIYNLRGQRVMTPSKGLYIMNGKKFFVK